MAINPALLRLQSGGYDEGMARRRTINNGAGQNGSFGDMITKAINSVDEQSKEADQKVSDVVSGKSDDVAGVMVSMQKAELSFQLMSQIRNKVVETYKELSRMQI